MSTNNIAPGTILLKILGQDNASVNVRMKKTSRMIRMMRRYSYFSGHKLSTLRFRFDGRVVREDDTPESLDMEEEDVIEAYLQQIGGFMV